VLNLCLNAGQSMPGGGIVTLSLERERVDAPRRLALGELQPGEWLRLIIADHGCGIDTAALPRIFEPLFSQRIATRGTGLGLAIVRNAVTRMRGAIDVESAPGAGTRFMLFARVAPTTGATPDQAQSRASRMVSGAGSYAGRGQSVLLVDDELLVVGMLEETTAALGYDVAGFADPRRALQAFERDPQRFDVVLSDVQMPGLGGCALVAALREQRPSLPVILMTAYRSTALETAARDAGASALLDKPVAPPQLAAALRAALRPAGAAAASATT
jgi:CheY-like chemotaxis protein